MNATWLLAVIGMLPPFGVAAMMCMRGPAGRRVVAVQMVGSIGVLLLIAITFAVGQASSIDLAIALGLLTLPAALLFAVFLERWL